MRAVLRSGCTVYFYSFVFIFFYLLFSHRATPFPGLGPRFVWVDERLAAQPLGCVLTCIAVHAQYPGCIEIRKTADHHEQRS